MYWLLFLVPVVLGVWLLSSAVTRRSRGLGAAGALVIFAALALFGLLPFWSRHGSPP